MIPFLLRLGMSEKLGPINYASNEGEVFLGRDFATHRDISEATSEMIDKEVRHIVDSGMNRAMDVLRDHIDILHRMSTLLIERETLDSDEIEMVIRGEELPPMEVKRMLQARMATGQNTGEKGSTSRPSATVIGPNAGGASSDISTGPDPSAH